jgi:hypothetical protein
MLCLNGAIYLYGVCLNRRITFISCLAFYHLLYKYPILVWISCCQHFTVGCLVESSIVHKSICWVFMCHKTGDDIHYFALYWIVSYLLAQLAETGTNSLRVLQELVGTLVNTSLLQMVGPTQLVKQDSKQSQSRQCINTNLLGCDALGCEIIDAVVEATLDQVAIQSKEILHLI